MDIDKKDFGFLLKKNGPVAIVIREKLRPAGGIGTTVFPPTYADLNDDKKASYNLDFFPNGGNRCTIDSIQSQANRLEEEFLYEPYSELVPQIIINAGEKKVNLLKAAHRLGDAAARFSSMTEEVDSAFNLFIEKNDCSLIAKLSPMSLIFGVWDSRGTAAKVARIFTSHIYASDVIPLTRSSVFNSSFTVKDVKKTENEESLNENEKKKWSTAGLANALKTGSLGGVIVNGEIIRESSINLNAVRRLKAKDDDLTRILQEYILALSLVCATLPQDGDLRSGCHLVRDGKASLIIKIISRDGDESVFDLNHKDALDFAVNAAKVFDVPERRDSIEFDGKKALDYLNSKTNEEKSKTSSKGK